MSRLFKDKSGLTMVELMIATLLLSVIFLAVSSLYVASQKFYITATQKVTTGYEAQYAIQHIYKHVMRSMGDKNTAPFQITGGAAPLDIQLDISINDSDPLTSANYTSGVENYRYRYDATVKKIFFRVGSGAEEDLIPKVSVTEVNFTETGNILTGYIKAYYTDPTQIITFYFGCYPRLASFN